MRKLRSRKPVLYSMDLAELVYKLFDNWNDEEEVLNVPDVFGICFQDVTEELKRFYPRSPLSIKAVPL